jgi:hypothetical protein
MLAESISTYLAADSGVRAQLGVPRPDNTTGIWPVQAPDEVAAPWVVYQQVSGNPLQESMQGTGRVQTARFRFTSYASTYKKAKQVAGAVKAAMLGVDGTMAAGQTEIHGSWLRLEIDEAEPMLRGTVFAVHTDFEIIFYDNA